MKRFLVLTLSCLMLAALTGFLPKTARAGGHATNVLLGVASVSEDNVWAVGQFITRTGGTQALIEHWNGHAWNTVSNPVPPGALNSQLAGITVLSARNIWAAGSFVSPSTDTVDTLIEHWNGSSWQIVPSPSPTGAVSSFFNGIAAHSKNDVWADGITQDSSGVHTLIEHWNGSSWQIVKSPSPGPQSNSLNAITAISRDDAWAVGEFFDSSGTEQVLFEHWNGSTWEVVPSATPVSGSLQGVAATSEDNAWAVGDIFESTGLDQTLIQHWNGSIWQVIKSPNPVGAQFSVLSAVTAVSARNAWAVGEFLASSGLQQTLIEHWNGKNWQIIPSPTPSSTTAVALRGVAAVPHDEDVWAVGDSEQDSSSLTLIEAWNGSTWRIVKSPTP